MRWERAYPPDDLSAATARRDALRCLGEAGVEGSLLDDVQLVVGELVVNAVRHAATDFIVILEMGADHIRVEVFDGGTQPPVMLASDLDATSGRGLVLVNALAGAWGHDTMPYKGSNGKTVWAEFDRQLGC
jgi:anti-sigma regulatory factor (Ser/Thr protein kinase)